MAVMPTERPVNRIFVELLCGTGLSPIASSFG
jgi:hypothetical protein